MVEQMFHLKLLGTINVRLRQSQPRKRVRADADTLRDLFPREVSNKAPPEHSPSTTAWARAWRRSCRPLRYDQG